MTDVKITLTPTVAPPSEKTVKHLTNFLQWKVDNMRAHQARCQQCRRAMAYAVMWEDYETALALMCEEGRGGPL